MSVSHWRVGRLIAMAIVALALAGGVAACGDSDDEDGGGETAQQADVRDGAEGDAGDGDRAADQGSDRDGDSSKGGGPSGSGASSGPDGSGDGSGAGDSSDSGGGSGGSGDGSGGSGGSSVEDAIASTVADMYRDIAEGDAAGVCAVMTRAARQQIAQDVPGGTTQAPGDRTCEASLGRFLEAAATSGLAERTLGTTVERVQVQGRRAKVTVRAAGQTGRVELVREDGEWRFGADAVAPGGGG